MKQKRLNAIFSFLNSEDKVIDVGCDHAYIAIAHAKQTKNHTLATDIHENALQIAKENILKNHCEEKITCILSDGLKKVDTTNYDTLVIAGMGFHTIQQILSETEKCLPIQKLIIQSNNELENLRKFVNHQGFALMDEMVVEEKGHTYIIMKWIRQKQKLPKLVAELGIYKPENQKYYQDLYEENKKIQSIIPIHHIKEKIKLWKQRKNIKKYLRQTMQKKSEHSKK